MFVINPLIILDRLENIPLTEILSHYFVNIFKNKKYTFPKLQRSRREIYAPFSSYKTAIGSVTNNKQKLKSYAGRSGRESLLLIF